MSDKNSHPKLKVCLQCRGLSFYTVAEHGFMTCDQCGRTFDFDDDTHTSGTASEGYGMVVFKLDPAVKKRLSYVPEDNSDEEIRDLIRCINEDIDNTIYLREDSNLDEYLKIFDSCFDDGKLIEDWSYITKARGKEVEYLRGDVGCFFDYAMPGGFDKYYLYR